MRLPTDISLILGYLASLASLSVIAFYVYGWATFDGNTWRAIFSSDLGLVISITMGGITAGFWVWMTTHFFRRSNNRSLAWTAILLLGFHLGATIYFISVYRHLQSANRARSVL